MLMGERRGKNRYMVSYPFLIYHLSNSTSAIPSPISANLKGVTNAPFVEKLRVLPKLVRLTMYRLYPIKPRHETVLRM